MKRKVRNHHISGETLPILRLPIFVDEDQQERVRTPQGGVLLLCIDPCGERGLFLEMAAVDAGCNVYERRSAKESMVGLLNSVPIAYRPGASCIPSRQVAFWERPKGKLYTYFCEPK